MLASRRQPLHLPLGHPSQQPSDYNFDFSSPPRRPSSSSSFDNYSSTTAPSPSTFDTDRLHQNYFSPSLIYAAPAPLSITPGAFADDYMSSGFDFSSPAIRVQQSTPTPQLSFGYPQQSVLADGGAQITNNWLYGEGNGQMMSGSSLQTPAVIRRNRSSHQRVPSSSSVGSSNSPASPFSQGQAPQIMYGNAVQSPSTAKLQSSYNADEASRNYSNHLPTPTQTPTQDSFVASSQAPFNPSYPNLDTAAAHMAMRHALADANSVTGDDAPDFSHSTRHSVSSFGRNSPATPRTINGEDFDEGFKVPSNDTYRANAQVPKLDRTMTDVFSDELYNPTSQPTPAQKAKNLSLLSPYHNAMMNERLQQANQARSQSPTTSSTRAISPFRQASPFAQTGSGFQSPSGRFGPQQIREQRQKAEAQANALSRSNAGDSQAREPKTISPKDALLEYHESEDDAKMPLFPGGDTASFSTFSSGNFQNSIPATAADNSYGSLAVGNAWTNPVGQSSASYGSATSAAPPQSTFTFAPSSVPGATHGFSSNSFSSSSNMPANPEDTPEFEYPAHLTSMESSVSEAPPQSSQNSNHTDIAAKPSSTLADTGTYTCTYHGCTQRFETPQKLQRHKREAHRQSTQQPQTVSQASPGIGSGMTSALIAQRNSQAGPHKCERTNPTTGKPCNTIFSRPYDLTRHEDTIHNSRKLKVRCALCQEEKTFSRNDALTRHMRVVHPDVDFPGKHRRRGARD